MNTPMTTKESEVDVLAVMDAEVVTMRRLECWVNEALTPTKLTADDAIARMEQARAAVAEVLEEAKNALDGLELSGLSFAATRLRAALRNAGVKV